MKIRLLRSVWIILITAPIFMAVLLLVWGTTMTGRLAAVGVIALSIAPFFVLTFPSPAKSGGIWTNGEPTTRNKPVGDPTPVLRYRLAFPSGSSMAEAWLLS